MGIRTGNPRGRPKGSKSKRTLQREQELASLTERATEALGIDAFEGDAHALLILTYKDKSLPIETRLEAARAAISYEKPKLSSIEANVAVTGHEAALDELE